MTRLPVAFIALTELRWGFGLLAAIGGERTVDIIGFFETAARIAPYEALIAFARLYQFALGHGSAAQRWPLNSAMRRMTPRRHTARNSGNEICGAAIASYWAGRREQNAA